MTSTNTIDMDSTLTLQQFRLWSTNALKAYLRIRSKTTDGDFEELVARYAAKAMFGSLFYFVHSTH
jgi:hypothetical protein